MTLLQFQIPDDYICRMQTIADRTTHGNRTALLRALIDAAEPPSAEAARERTTQVPRGRGARIQRLMVRFAGFLDDSPTLQPLHATRSGFAAAATTYVRTGCWPAEWMN